ncbi:type II toxin-antitoxin system RelE/ParE family toxin [Streptomyces sp. NPDC047130]|uniref:type II toxin-antitoxin system RelE/ParE family toxin n=1 Tax=Streptomyces sp. NPDC047130 TaxID=3155261 RepID=UPI0033E961F1
MIKEDLGSASQVAQAVAALREAGPTLGRPLVDRLKGSELHHLKELRPGSGGRSEIRIIFAFDPTRSALLLLGGDKAGNWERWYRDHIPLAEQLYREYVSDDED